METNKSSYSFLVVGSTTDSESRGSFKRYVGYGSSYVLAVNPTKAELEKLEGREIANDPEYIVDTDNGKEVRITFIVKPDPKVHEGVDMTQRVTFTLRNAPAYNRDQTSVQVIDKYGDHVWAPTEDAKAGKKIITSAGTEARIDTYRMACVGECDLVDFLKTYLGVPNAYNYINGAYVKKEAAEAAKAEFKLENVKDYFSGDFSELKQALAMQPNNKVKLLYGVRTTEDGKQYQTVCTRGELILRNYADSRAMEKAARRLASAKQAGSYASTDYRVVPLQEWEIAPTDLNNTPSTPDDLPFPETSSEMPWE